MDLVNHIDKTTFGSITVNGQIYDHDILISLDGTVSKRKKKLSKQIFGTSHVISQAEAEYIYESGAGQVIFGAGHNGMLILSTEAADFFRSRNCRVILMPTPEAVDTFNLQTEPSIGLFHITC